MKTIEVVANETKGRAYTIAEFMEDVVEGLISPYDGFGYFHDGEKLLNQISVWAYDFDNENDWSIIKNYPYVVWYNK